MPQRSIGRQASVERNGPAPVPASVAPAPTPLRVRRGAVAWSDGMRAERAASDRLRAEGWRILAERARTPAGEIDIVAERSGLLAFVEVKARPTLADAASSLSVRQCRRLRNAAAILLAANPHWPTERVRFDLLLVDRVGAMRRIADAFRQDDPETGR